MLTGVESYEVVFPSVCAWWPHFKMAGKSKTGQRRVKTWTHYRTCRLYWRSSILTRQILTWRRLYELCLFKVDDISPPYALKIVESESGQVSVTWVRYVPKSTQFVLGWCVWGEEFDSFCCRLRIHHDVSSDRAWWLPYREPCVSCQRPASAGLGSPGDRRSHSGHVCNTRRRRLITCCRLWPAARRFWLGLHLVTVHLLGLKLFTRSRTRQNYDLVHINGPLQNFVPLTRNLKQKQKKTRKLQSHAGCSPLQRGLPIQV